MLKLPEPTASPKMPFKNASSNSVKPPVPGASFVTGSAVWARSPTCRLKKLTDVVTLLAAASRYTLPDRATVWLASVVLPSPLPASAWETNP